VAAVQLGISRRSLDAAGDLVMVKPGRGRNARLIENAYVQRQLMRTEGAWLAAYAGVEQALIRMWRDAEKSRRLPIDTRIALLTANIHASTAATEIVESVCGIVGTSVASAKGIFAACLRDSRTICGHGAVNGYKLETAAQMRFGFLEDSFAV
jgi:alkylation response protein AidB-like acyl-CoA dehydrogenase